jgi:predicted aconitase with swiveling domain
MAKKTFKGRPLLPGDLKGKATVSKQPFNTSGSYFDNMFAGVTDKAICTDSDNPELYKKDITNCILCTPQTIGSSFAGATIMGVKEMGVGPNAMLFIDLLGDEFLETVKTGDPISIHEDGTVEVG